jgi:hypothetical protein
MDIGYYIRSIFNLLAESAACTAVNSACLIMHGDNTKGNKNNFLRRKTQHITVW